MELSIPKLKNFAKPENKKFLIFLSTFFVC